MAHEPLEGRHLLAASIVALDGLANFSNSQAYGLNDLGQVVGEVSDAQGDRHAFLYSNGTMTDLGTLPGFQDSIAYGINDSGTIVGELFNPGDGPTEAFDDSNGVMTPTVANGSTMGINDAGQEVGTATNPATGVQQAYLISGGVTTFLPLAGGATSSQGDSIDRLGQVAGSLDGDAGFVYSGGATTPISLSGAQDVLAEIDDAGTVVGSDLYSPSIYVNPVPNGFISAGGVTSVSTDPLYGIDDAGQIVGSTGGLVFGLNYVPPDAIVISGGTTIDLNSLLPANSGWTLRQATAINDLGQIIGLGILNDVPQAFLLTLPDPPSTLSASVEPPSTVVAGTAFSLSASVETTSGAPAPDYDGPVTVSIVGGPAGESLGGSTTVDAVGGVATFSGLTLDASGSAALTITAPGLASATTPEVTISPGTATQITLSTAPPSGISLDGALGLHAQVAYASGVLDADYNGPLTVALASGPSGETLTGTTTATATGGIADFPDLRFSTTGSVTLTISAPGLTPATTPAIAVSPDALKLTSAPPLDVITGDPFGLTVDVVDASGNPVPGANGLVTLTETGPSGEILGGGTNVSAVDGVATFADLTLNTAGSVTLTASYSGLSPITVAALTVTPPPPAQLVVLAPTPGSTVQTDVPLTVTVEVEDAEGRVVTGFNGAVIEVATINGRPNQGILAVTAKAGIAQIPERFTTPGPVTGYSFEIEPTAGVVITTPLDLNVVGVGAPDDFFGDGVSDLGVYGYSRYLIAQQGTPGVIEQPFGGPLDQPVVGDFFGDGKADVGVYGYGRFLIAEPGTTKVIDQPLGGPDDKPVVGDFFGDGRDDLAVYGYGRFFIYEPSTGRTLDVPIGGPEDVPVVGDFFGDGKDDVGVYGYGRFVVTEPGTSNVQDVYIGGPEDRPVVGDFFGDGVDDFGVYGYGRFSIVEKVTNKTIDQPFGGPDDVPVIGDFFGDGKDDLGVYGYGRYLIAEPGTTNILDQPFGGPLDAPIEEAPAFLPSTGTVTAEAVQASPAAPALTPSVVTEAPAPSATPSGPIGIVPAPRSKAEKRDLDRPAPPRIAQVAQADEPIRQIGLSHPRLRGSRGRGL